MNKNKGEDYAEKMEMMTNKAAKDIVHYLTSHVDHSKTYAGSGVLCAFDDYKPIKLMIWRTFTDTNLRAILAV